MSHSGSYNVLLLWRIKYLLFWNVNWWFLWFGQGHFDLYDYYYYNIQGGGVYHLGMKPCYMFLSRRLGQGAASSIKFTLSLFTLATYNGLFNHRLLSVVSQKWNRRLCVGEWTVGSDVTRKQRLQRRGLPKGQIELPACPFTHTHTHSHLSSTCPRPATFNPLRNTQA